MAMQELGEMLRAARQEKGLTLADAEEATRIRQRYLEALEYGDEHGLPAPVYVEGFLRGYAAYLGLPLPAVLDKYRSPRPRRRAHRPACACRCERSKCPGPLVGRGRSCWVLSWLDLILVGAAYLQVGSALPSWPPSWLAFVAALVDAGRCPARGDRNAARRQQPGGHTDLRTIGRCTSSRIHPDSRAHGHANRHPGARGHR